jgi:2-octaprenyl-6-methoxyphenol hydroxylase
MKNNKQNTSSVVWTTEFQHKFKNRDKLLSEFKKKYRDFFGTILNATNPVEYNLNVFYCYKYFKKKVVLIGDACQAIHPIAGQGLNLGIRDSYSLANSLKEAEDLGLEYSDSIVLNKYTQNRLIDKNLLIQSTHNLNRLFSNGSLVFSLFRKIGMRIFNKSKLLKKQSMLFAMGLKDFNL